MPTSTLLTHTRAGLVVATALLCACISGPAHPVTVTFHVSAPLSTPTTASVSIVGDAPALGGGKAPGLILTKLADGEYSGKAVLEAESSVHFQIVLRAPDAIELKDDFSVPDRTLTVGPQGQAQTVTLGVARWEVELPDTHAPVLFQVQAPAYTPPAATLYLTGDAPELGAWRPNAVPLVRRADGKYVSRVGLEKGKAIQFKVTRGTWRTQERGPIADETVPYAEDIPNRTYTVPGEGGTVEAAPATWQDLEPTAILTGTIEYQRDVPSAILGNTRHVIIHLPVGYAQNTTTRYPVLYMHDGQNLMDPRTSFDKKTEWGVDEAAQRLQRCGQMAPVIIVGVYNAGDKRLAEYTQVPDADHPGGGDADKYGRFLMEELKPLIDAEYRTMASAPAGIAGSSLGGLVSLYLALKHPGTFGRVGAVSPSLWWADQDIIDRYDALTAKLPLRIWEDMGTAEGDTPEAEVADARAFRDVLVKKGWVEGEDLAYLEAANARHDEAAWSARIDQVLSTLYPPQ